MYSSTHDLSSLGLSILSNRLLSPSTIRRWLKPFSHTSSIHFSIGAPWEIHRVAFNSTGRIVDLYTKSGSVGSYASLLILDPDHGTVYTVLTAGNSTDLVNVIGDGLVEAFLPATETLAEEQAMHRLAANFSSSKVNSSVEFIVDGSPGLGIKTWISNGVDLLEVFAALSEEGGSEPVGLVRVYPTNLLARNCTGGYKQSFRAVLQTQAIQDEAGGAPRIFSNFDTWSSVDSLVYGQISVDELVFHLDGSGKTVAVDVRFLRITLYRVE